MPSVARGSSRNVLPVEPEPTPAKRSPRACSRSASVGTSTTWPPLTASSARRLRKSSVPNARPRSTAGTYIWLPTIPLVPGWAPVASVAALTRVTVGNTAWLFVKATPSARSRESVGVSSAVMASGRSPSTTNTMTKRVEVGMTGRPRLYGGGGLGGGRLVLPRGVVVRVVPPVQVRVVGDRRKARRVGRALTGRQARDHRVDVRAEEEGNRVAVAAHRRQRPVR